MYIQISFCNIKVTFPFLNLDRLQYYLYNSTIDRKQYVQTVFETRIDYTHQSLVAIAFAKFVKCKCNIFLFTCVLCEVLHLNDNLLHSFALVTCNSCSFLQEEISKAIFI